MIILEMIILKIQGVQKKIFWMMESLGKEAEPPNLLNGKDHFLWEDYF